MASILMPNQGAVMLWQTVRSTVIELSAALMQLFRRSKARPADVDAEIQTGFDSDLLAVTLPKQPPAQKPEKKIPVQAAA